MFSESFQNIILMSLNTPQNKTGAFP